MKRSISSEFPKRHYLNPIKNSPQFNQDYSVSSTQQKSSISSSRLKDKKFLNQLKFENDLKQIKIDFILSEISSLKTLKSSSKQECINDSIFSIKAKYEEEVQNSKSLSFIKSKMLSTKTFWKQKLKELTDFSEKIFDKYTKILVAKTRVLKESEVTQQELKNLKEVFDSDRASRDQSYSAKKNEKERLEKKSKNIIENLFKIDERRTAKKKNISSIFDKLAGQISGFKVKNRVKKDASYEKLIKDIADLDDFAVKKSIYLIFPENLNEILHSFLVIAHDNKRLSIRTHGLSEEVSEKKKTCSLLEQELNRLKKLDEKIYKKDFEEDLKEPDSRAEESLLKFYSNFSITGNEILYKLSQIASRWNETRLNVLMQDQISPLPDVWKRNSGRYNSIRNQHKRLTQNAEPSSSLNSIDFSTFKTQSELLNYIKLQLQRNKPLFEFFLSSQVFTIFLDLNLIQSFDIVFTNNHSQDLLNLYTKCLNKLLLNFNKLLIKVQSIFTYIKSSNFAQVKSTHHISFAPPARPCKTERFLIKSQSNSRAKSKSPKQKLKKRTISSDFLSQTHQGNLKEIRNYDKQIRLIRLRLKSFN